MASELFEVAVGGNQDGLMQNGQEGRHLFLAIPATNIDGIIALDNDGTL